MGKYLFLFLTSMLFWANISLGAEDKYGTEELSCIKRFRGAYNAASEVGEALDGLVNNGDPTVHFLVTAAHFGATLAGTYQALRPYLDDTSAGWVALGVSSVRMLWVPSQPVGSVPGTITVVLAAWDFNS